MAHLLGLYDDRTEIHLNDSHSSSDSRILSTIRSLLAETSQLAVIFSCNNDQVRTLTCTLVEILALPLPSHCITSIVVVVSLRYLVREKIAFKFVAESTQILFVCYG